MVIFDADQIVVLRVGWMKMKVWCLFVEGM